MSFEGNDFQFFSFNCVLEDVFASNRLNTCFFQPKSLFSLGAVALTCRLNDIVIYNSSVHIFPFPFQLSVSPLELYESVISTITLKGPLRNVSMCTLDETTFPIKFVAENIYECEVLLRRSRAELFLSFLGMNELIPTSIFLFSVPSPEIYDVSLRRNFSKLVEANVK